MSTQESKPSSKAVQEVLQWLLGHESARFKVKPNGQQREVAPGSLGKEEGHQKPE